MIEITENPWKKMPADSSRRVDFETNHNFFWITDLNDRYGFLITFKFSLIGIEIERKVKGISIITTREPTSGRLYLLLNDNADWQIFLSVCRDLIISVGNSVDEVDIIPIVNQRIRRWQKFLIENHSESMPEPLQMGLITELYCMLHSLIPSLGYKESILNWVGPDLDKKDFSLAMCFIEAKSFISSKGQVVKISSLQQLDNEVKPLYLAAYGLTRSDRGLSIIDLVDLVNEAIPLNDYEMRDLFDIKLAAYGFIENVTKPPFFHYLFDTSKFFFVSED